MLSYSHLSSWLISITSMLRKMPAQLGTKRQTKKINTLLVDNGKITTKLAFIQWLGGIAATASIGSIITALYGAIFK